MTALVITLIIVGLLLLGAELIVIPGFGFAGILGVVSLVASCWLAFAHIGTTAGIIAIVANILLVTLTTVLMLRSGTWKKLSLKTNINAKAGTPLADSKISVGDTGVTLTRLAPVGKIQIGNTIMEACSRDSLIDPNCKVRVTELAEQKIYVKALE